MFTKYAMKMHLSKSCMYLGLFTFLGVPAVIVRADLSTGDPREYRYLVCLIMNL